MKAPDKIYIDESELADSTPDYISVIAWNIKPLNPIAYIRKDALLEWAKERYNHYAQEPGKAGEREICLQLVDKLNSM